MFFSRYLSPIFVQINRFYPFILTNTIMKTCYSVIFFFLFLTAEAQWKWSDPHAAGYPVVQNQGFTDEIGNTYDRLPGRAKKQVRDAVWHLAGQAVGLAVHFYSDAPVLTVRYGTAYAQALPHMPATGVSGLDLYAIDSDGNWQRCVTGNYSFRDTVRFTWTGAEPGRYHRQGTEYRLYLPLYNRVEWLEIGVPDSCSIEYIPVRREKPVVVYGTSIAQGACASRPGMAWTNILSRRLDYPVVNLGFSGNGRLEKEVTGLIAEIDAALYVFDCLPNLTGLSDERLDSLIRQAVGQIRTSHPETPILLTEHAGGDPSYGNPEAASRNAALRRICEALSAEGVEDLYYLSCAEIGLPEDAIVDYVHPSDLGMQLEADAYEKKIREILNMPSGTSPATRAVTQRREPGHYEWLERHRTILETNAARPPRAVILGNSIVHYWGGEPADSWQRGKDSWDRILRPAGFRNLGCGYDRIENLLWRIYHGELDGYRAERVVVMIGTNNLTSDTPDEILAGLRRLTEAIKIRQPEARIRVAGLLPRRNNEEKIASLNRKIELSVQESGCSFVDLGKVLLGSDGKIDESLFTDGLHPNARGYEKIAPALVR